MRKKISCHWRVRTLDFPGRSLFCVVATLHRLPEILMYFIRIKVQCSKIDYLKFYLFTDEDFILRFCELLHRVVW